MEIISIANLKGGVGKSTTAINLANNLAQKGYRVLLIDNDKQGNTSEFFNLLDENKDGTHTILLESEVDVKSIIQKTKYERLNVMPTNMLLQFADSNAKNDMIIPPQQKYKLALEQIKNDYDYCIIDNAPSLDISVINSLVCADKILITVKVDNFSRVGLKILSEQLETIRRYYNPKLDNVNILYTMCNNSNVSIQGQKLIDESLDDMTPNITYKSFNTCIRRTVVVDECTFAKKPLSIYSPEATATVDYYNLTQEIIND